MQRPIETTTYRCPLRFNQSENAVVYSIGAQCHNPVRLEPNHWVRRNELAKSLVQSYGAESGYIGQVKVSLIHLMPRGVHSIERIAAYLELNARTLQRRLKAEGTSYSELMIGFRAELARRYLIKEQYSLVDTASLLGFRRKAILPALLKSGMAQLPMNILESKIKWVIYPEWYLLKRLFTVGRVLTRQFVLSTLVSTISVLPSNDFNSLGNQKQWVSICSTLLYSSLANELPPLDRSCHLHRPLLP